MELIEAKSIFSTATGFIQRGGFDFTSNPYVGCTFGCSYCYAMFLPQNDRDNSEWGKWIVAKQNAVELASKQAKKVRGKAVYVSSVTDPYQPVERSLGLTRGILEAMLPHQPRLVIQTRGPLVIRDIDLLQKFESVRVNLSIPTDSEEVRMAFEPKAPPLEKRWAAIRELKASGISVGVTVTPTLPILDASSFVLQIRELAPDLVVTQYFHAREGGGADTSKEALEIAKRYDWNELRYQTFVKELSQAGLPLFEGEEGFFPPPAIPREAEPSLFE